MNKKIFDTISKKAAVQVCLFLFWVSPLAAQEFRLDPVSKAAYEQAMKLDFDEVRRLLPTPKTPQELYVTSLAETFRLILTEDETLLSEYEAAADKRKNRAFRKTNPDELLLQTELHIHWMFIYLKFGRELDAAMELRHAYLLSENIRERFPSYRGILKTAGLLNVMIGSVPEKYNWILSLLSMKGSVPEGLSQMKTLMNSTHDLAYEAGLWHAFIHGFVLQKPEEAIAGMKQLKGDTEEQPIATFMTIAFLIKNSQNEEALELLNKSDSYHTVIPYIRYLKGETLLHKGEYENAISSYQWFTDHYKGQNFLKDAHYKIGLCHYLSGRTAEAARVFHHARTTGVEHTEADRNAARALNTEQMAPVPLIKVRYLTDGGYYEQARELLKSVDVKTLSGKKAQVEYYYRQGRLAHKTGDLAAAKNHYLKTIALNEGAEWYFAPNAALQLGYIFTLEKKYREARNYFELAMTFKRHEYKNSIDSKARSALAQLNGLK